MRVRYVNTLDKASSGMSLKAEHSGRVMMTLESSPRPPWRGKIHSTVKTHTHTNKQMPKMSSSGLLRTHLRGKQPVSLYSLPLPSCSGGGWPLKTNQQSNVNANDTTKSRQVSEEDGQEEQQQNKVFIPINQHERKKIPICVPSTAASPLF